MNKNLKMASLAAAIALAMGSTAAMAADVTAAQLPGKGKVVAGGATAPTPTAGSMTVTLTGNTVIDWGKGTATGDLNPTGVGGFNIGSDAMVNFNGAFGVLNVDSTGNASQILGQLTGAGNLFVANANGIIVGQDAVITSTTGGVGLIANTLSSTFTDFDGTTTTLAYAGTGGDVTVAADATLVGTSVLITGGNVVNVDVGALPTGVATTISAGLPAGTGATGRNTNAMVNLTNADSSSVALDTGDVIASAGGASTAGAIALDEGTASSIEVAGTFTNNGVLTLPTATSFEGSFVNNGQLVATGDLAITAAEDLTLYGPIGTLSGTTYTPLSSSDALSGSITLTATDGTLSNYTGLHADDDVVLQGNAVKVYSNVSSGGAVGILAGDTLGADDYAVRVAKGVTVSGDGVYVGGMDDDLHPNVILQGRIAGNDVLFGGASERAVSDVFSGPEGGIVLTGANPSLVFDFTGRIKTAPYLNQDNFRYNALPVSMDDAATGTVDLALNPVAYRTNGTDNGLSAVNLLVDGDVTLSQNGTAGYAPIGPNGSAVTGVLDIPNTHLVLQSTGDLNVAANYWPGYVYLGNISADANGKPLPGTLSGLGQISLTNASGFSNVLPGDVDGASGIHFMTQFPVEFASTVTTNANAWVNFATEGLTETYQLLNTSKPFLYGGQLNSTKVVTYGVLGADSIHTKTPVADNQ